MPTKRELEAEADRLKQQAEEAAARAAAAQEEAAKPRTADDVFHELVHAILMHIGNPPHAAALYKELQELSAARPKPIELKPEETHDATDGPTS